MADDGEVTQILRELSSGDEQQVWAELVPHVYDELKTLARSYLSQERKTHTLQTTALIHEAYMRLTERHTIDWENRRHFFRAAAKTMRRVLVNHALAKRAAKRGGEALRQPLDDHVALASENVPDLLALDEAMANLSIEDRRKAQIVELRYFAGCTIDETADVLGISTATVEREWRFARAWLRSMM